MMKERSRFDPENAESIDPSSPTALALTRENNIR
jgi:hypothetical protein